MDRQEVDNNINQNIKDNQTRSIKPENVRNSLGKILDYVDEKPSNGGSWGGITGNIDDQLDLKSALANKVDEETGKGLSQENYTTGEKTKLAGLEGSHFRGRYTTLIALQAITNPVAGDYADLDEGVGKDVSRYIFDADDAKWVEQGGKSTEMGGAQIKQLYEAEPDTNALTDARRDKLDGIQAGANKTVVDTTLSSVSTNPVQNKIIDAKIKQVEASISAGATGNKLFMYYNFK